MDGTFILFIPKTIFLDNKFTNFNLASILKI